MVSLQMPPPSISQGAQAVLPGHRCDEVLLVVGGEVEHGNSVLPARARSVVVFLRKEQVFQGLACCIGVHGGGSAYLRQLVFQRDTPASTDTSLRRRPSQPQHCRNSPLSSLTKPSPVIGETNRKREDEKLLSLYSSMLTRSRVVRCLLQTLYHMKRSHLIV